MIDRQSAGASTRPQPIVDQAPTCWRCGRVLMGYAGRPWSVTCKRCRAKNKSGPAPDRQP
jgi:hypothetical protein